MAFLKYIGEKLLTTMFISFLISFGMISFMTGQFPPAKQDFARMASLTKEFLFAHSQVQENEKKLNQGINLQQMVEFQRLALRRSEIALELSGILKRIPQQAVSQDMAEQLMLLDQDMKNAETRLQKISAQFSPITETSETEKGDL